MLLYAAATLGLDWVPLPIKPVIHINFLLSQSLLQLSGLEVIIMSKIYLLHRKMIELFYQSYCPSYECYKVT